MKKRVFLSLALLIALLSLSFHTIEARERSVEEAEKIANEVFSKEIRTRAASNVSLEMVWSGDLMTRSGQAPAFYVFDNMAGPGFVIVSGEDTSIPILGYSFDNEFKVEGMPANIKTWFEGLQEEIGYLRESSSATFQTEDISSVVGNDVIKHVTALWNQDAPYNALCPKDGYEETFTGCVPTAVAIVMHYHKWPAYGKGTIPAYTTRTHGLYVPEIELGHEYDWDDLPADYSNGYTQKEATAVATLMRDCGAMLQADYGTDATGAYSDDIPYALATYMDYDPSIRCLRRGYFSMEEWTSMLNKELTDNGPVLYAGSDDDSAHQFVLDGYTDKGYYSVNWGWGGNSNGYYVLTAMNPDSHGIGGNQGGFSLQQSAIFNVKKNENSSPIERLEFVRYEKDGVTYNGLHTDETVFAPGAPFIVYAGLMCNHGIYPYTGKYGLAVTDSRERIKEIIYDRTVKELPVRNGYLIKGISVTITVDIEYGDRLVAVYYDNNSDEYKKITGNSESGATDFIALKEIQEEDRIENNVSLDYDAADGKIIIKATEEVSAELYDMNGTYIPYAVSEEGNNIIIETSLINAGTYLLKLYNNRDIKELYFTI